jgi:hypothetical protein
VSAAIAAADPFLQVVFGGKYNIALFAEIKIFPLNQVVPVVIAVVIVHLR